MKECFRSFRKNSSKEESFHKHGTDVSPIPVVKSPQLLPYLLFLFQPAPLLFSPYIDLPRMKTPEVHMPKASYSIYIVYTLVYTDNILLSFLKVGLCRLLRRLGPYCHKL